MAQEVPKSLEKKIARPLVMDCSTGHLVCSYSHNMQEHLRETYIGFINV